MMVFDKHLFKSTSGGRELDTEILFHLGKPEHYRTWEEAQKTAQALKFIRSFSSLPRLYQERLAMIAWYMEVPADKVIIREGHIADSFYFLITGKVVAVKLIGSPAFEHRSKFKVLKVFDKDEMFGEEGISNRGNRGYSVTSIVKCTLLSVNIDDYYRICNYCSSPDENPDHIRMLSQMDFMKYFPMQELIENNEGKVILFYYRKGLVITPDSGKSEYIYIVKSGTCQLLTCVKSLRATKRYKCVKVSLPPIKARRGTLVLEPPPLPECRVFPDNSDESCKLSAPQFSAIITKQEEEQDESYESKHTASAMVHWASQDILESSAEQSREAIDDKESLTSSFTEFSLTFDRSQNRVLDSALTKCYNENRRDCAIPRKNMLPKTKRQLIRPPKSRPKLSKVSSKKGNSKTTTEWNSNHLTSEKERRLVHNDPIETQPNSDGNNSYVPKQSLVKSLPKQGDALLDKYAPGTILNTSESIAGLCEDSVFEQKMEKYVSRWKKSSISKRTSEYSKVGTVFQKAGSIEKFIQTQRENSESDLIWLRVKTLRESDVYGIEDLNLGDTKETNETKVALVSDGAEVILVSKEFIMANAGPAMKAYLRSSSYIKPDRDTLFLDLQKREYWSKFQEKTVNAFENELHISRKQEN
nr:cyclic nucleotide-binding domain-containing protein 2-like isoform X3 [Biomphalaria glabrata]